MSSALSGKISANPRVRGLKDDDDVQVCCGCFDSLKLVKHEVRASVLFSACSVHLFSACSVELFSACFASFGLFWYPLFGPFDTKTLYLPY